MTEFYRIDIQSHIGRYNLLSPTEESFNFKAIIYCDEKIVEIDGIKAILSYSGEPEKKDDFDYWTEKNYWDNITSECLDYANRIISTRDYKKEALAFIRAYTKHFLMIESSYREIKSQEIRSKIASLDDELKKLCFPDVTYELAGIVSDEISKETKRLNYLRGEQSQFKKSSTKHKEISERIGGVSKTITDLTTILKELEKELGEYSK